MHVKLFRIHVFWLMNHTESLRRLVHFDDIPDEILLEIFKWIPFDELTFPVKLVNKRWNAISSTTSLHPHVLVITRLSNPKTVHHILSTYSENLSLIEFQDIYGSRVISSLNSRRWSNLRTLSIKWKHHILDGVRIPVTYINRVIDRSPRLISIELRECFVHGDMTTLLEKLRDRGIYEFTFMNRYLVVDGIEKLFGLRDMTKFRVCCYPLGDFSSSICTFCTNNRHSLTSLALRIDNRSTGSDDVINAITSCSMLRILHLIGRFNLSSEGLRKISELKKLRSLKIQVHLIDGDEFAKFLDLPFARKLTALGVHWSRPVSEREFSSIINCENLNKLTVVISDYFNDTEMISDVLIRIAERLRLKKLKIISDFCMVDCLPEICTKSKDLFYIKFVHGYETKHLKKFKNKVKSFDNLYECKYVAYKSEMHFMLRKKIDIQVKCSKTD